MSATLASPLLFGVVVIGEAVVGLALLFGVVVIEEAVVGLDCVVDFGLAPPTLRSRMEFLIASKISSLETSSPSLSFMVIESCTGAI